MAAAACSSSITTAVSPMPIHSLAAETPQERPIVTTNWIGLCSVLRPRQHSIGYMGDGFYRSKDPTNSIKVLKEEVRPTTKH